MSSSGNCIFRKMSGSGNWDSGKRLREKVYLGKLTSGNGQTGVVFNLTNAVGKIGE